MNKYLINQFLYNKKIIPFLFLFLSIYLFSTIILQQIELFWYKFYGIPYNQFYEVFTSFKYQVFNAYLPHFLGSMALLAFRLFSDFWNTKSRLDILKQEKISNELEFLKAQINPHFLFNSLNSLYAEIEKSNTTARHLLIKFSDLLRYQLYECRADKIEIEKEALYIQNYVSLGALRKNENFELEVEMHELYNFKIPPLLMITFIENAFKYVSNHSTQKNIIRIIIRYSNNVLDMYVYNTKDLVKSRELSPNQGIGIKNVRRRLELLYPKLHTLNISETANYFEVELKLVLNET